MAGINFDATLVAPNSGFSPVEKGKYQVIISKSEFKHTANGAGKKIELYCVIQGGPSHGRNILFIINWENASEMAVKIGRGQFSAICHAVNVLQVQDTQQLHNIPFCLEVDVTPDGKYNEVIGIYPIQQPAPQSQVYQQPAPQSQVYQQPAPQSQVYQQPAPQSQVYQQPAPQSQVYQQPAPQSQVTPAVPDWILNQQRAQEAKSKPMGNGH